ncbi:vWA domain-containing protein, partial [Lewinella sp. W8]|uniref:vWA domain-containing protein n=1 Tax=Lewinella sp. W8 TaxID=2528208 RepID=UPI00142C8F39
MALLALLFSSPVGAQNFCPNNTPGNNCDSCPNYNTNANPDLVLTCESPLKLIIMIDESNSLNGFQTDMRNGVMAFLEELACTPVQVAIIEYGTFGNYVVNAYTPVADVVTGMSNYFSGTATNSGSFTGQVYTVPSGNNGATNWQAAFMLADALPVSDLTLMFTDGNPTAYVTNGTSPTSSASFCGSGASTQEAEIYNPVQVANKLRNEGTHLFALGIGANFNQGFLSDISGPTQYNPNDSGDALSLATADYAIEPNFSNLQNCLAEFANNLCPIATTCEVEPTCTDQSNGQISIQIASDVQAPYTIQVAGMSSFQTSSNPVVINNLSAGTYTVNIQASGDCFRDDQCVVTVEEGSPSCHVSATTDELCDGTLGTATFTVMDGFPNYTYTIINDADNSQQSAGNYSGGLASFTVNDIPAGDYTINITDDENCTTTCTFSIAAATGCCTPAADCKHNLDIDEEGCELPPAETHINRIFKNVEDCGEHFLMDVHEAHLDDNCVGGLSVTRTYFLFIDGNGNGTYQANHDQLIESCDQRVTITPPVVSSHCPDDRTVAPCLDQHQVNNRFTNFLNDFSCSGGCALLSSSYYAYGQYYANPHDIPAPDKCGGAVTVRLVCENACGNDSDCSATFTVPDNTDPIIKPSANAPADLSGAFDPNTMEFTSDPVVITFECDEVSGAISNQTVQEWFMVSDDCQDLDVHIDEIVTESDADCKEDGYFQYYLCNISVTDHCGQTDQLTIDIKVIDSTPPVVDCPDNTDASSACLTQDEVDAEFRSWLSQFSCTDNCGATSTYIVNGQAYDNPDHIPAPDKCGGAVTVMLVCENSCGVTAGCSATFTVPDNTDPIIKPSANAPTDLSDAFDANTMEFTSDPVVITFECDEVSGPIFNQTVQGWFMVSDDCQDLDVHIDEIVTESDADCKEDGYFQYYLCNISVTDHCGQTDQLTIDIKVIDSTPPVVDCPDNTDASSACLTDDEVDAEFRSWLGHFSCTDNCGATSTYIVNGQAYDNPDHIPAPDKCGGAVTVRLVCENSCGVTADCSATFTVPDNTDPIIKPSANAPTDLSDAFDANTMEFTSDPVVITFECDEVSGPIFNQTVQGWFMVSDDCQDLDVHIDEIVTESDANCKEDGYFQYYLCNISVTDHCGQTDQLTIDIKVIDSTPPVVDCPDNTDASSACLTDDEVDAEFRSWLGHFSCTDNCGATSTYYVDGQTYTNPDHIPAPDKCGGAVTVRLVCENSCGVTADCSATFTVPDNTDPILKPSANAPTDLDQAFDGGTMEFTSDPVMINLECSDYPNGLTNNLVKGWFMVADDCSNPNIHIQELDIDENGNCIEDGYLKRYLCKIKVTDECGQMDMVTIDIKVVDTEAPTASCPDDRLMGTCKTQQQVNHAFANWLDQFGCADNCGATSTYYVNGQAYTNSDHIPAPDKCGGTVTVRLVCKDACGNRDDCSATFTVPDNTDPILKPSANAPTDLSDNFDGSTMEFTANPVMITLECSDYPNGLTNNLVKGWFMATDDCSDPDIHIQELDIDEDGNCMQDGYLKRYLCKVKVTDECGQMDMVTIDIKVVDNTKPVITHIGPDGTFECGTDPVFSTPQASDDCDQDVSLIFVDTYGAPTCAGRPITRTWTATDDCGNTETASQTLTPVDTRKPVITHVGADGTFECSTDPVFSTPQASDDCDQDVSLTFMDTYGAPNCAGRPITRTWTATDDCGNTQTASQTLTPVDTRKPVITHVGADGTFECSTDPVFSTPQASDDCDQDVSLTFVDTYGAPNCAGRPITRTWTATDDCGNTQTASQTLTPVDNTPPTITCPADVTVDCEDDTSPAFTGRATCSDSCPGGGGGDPATDCDPSIRPSHAGGVTPDGLFGDWNLANDFYADMYRAGRTDKPVESKLYVRYDCNTQTMCVLVLVVDGITARRQADDAFVKLGNSNKLIDGNDPGFSWVEDPNSSDPLGFEACFTLAPGTYNNLNVHLQVNDGGSQTSAVANRAIPICLEECDSDGGGCTDDNGPTYSDQIVPGNCAGNYTIRRTWTCSDCCGNTAQCVQTITVRDTDPPVLEMPSPIADIACNDPLPTQETLTATDNCSGVTVVPSVDPYTVDICNGYPITYRWTATDDCGNSSVKTATFNVLPDTQSPVLEEPAPIADINCDDPLPTQETLTATDDCSSVTVTPSVDPYQVDVCNGYSITYRWVAVDACGNQDVETVTFNVLPDTQSPVLEEPAPIADINCNDPLPTQETLTATDDCSSITVTPSVDPYQVDVCNGYSITYRWVAHDACGNEDVETATFNVLPDTQSPVLEEPAPITDINCNDPLPTQETLTATDDCSSVTVTPSVDPYQVDVCNGYSITYRWVAVDACGNQDVETATFNVRPDTESPVLEEPAPIADINCDDPLPTQETLTATDDCSSVTVTPSVDPYQVDVCNGYSITYRWVAVDACGNQDVETVTFNVRPDTESPVLEEPAPIADIDCDDPLPTQETLTATDDCSSVTVTPSVDPYQVDVCNGYSITYRWVAVDACGNQDVETVTFNVRPDTESPVLEEPAPIADINCDDPLPTQETLTATDDCSSVTVTPSVDPYQVDVCNGYSITYRWVAVDACGNQDVETVTFNVLPDTESPVLEEPAPIADIDCDDPLPTQETLTATDDCSSVTVTPSVDPYQVDVCNGYSITYRWVARDACGNQDVETVTFNVRPDTESPVLEEPAPIADIDCDDPLPTQETLTATDDCSSVTVTPSVDPYQVDVCNG